MRNPLDILRRGDRVAVLRLEGVIGSVGRLGGAALTDTGLAPLIETAFRRGRPKAVALAINSPGGSPAQSSLIAARIRRLAEEVRVPVHAFVEDVAASGGYWLATAADRIHLDPNSIVGSIGVISASFGFQDLLARHGIERRVHTAGQDKSLLDPFRPERPEDVARLKQLQAQIHANFIAQVKSRRGDRLKGDELFTGDIWVGQAGVDTGLADGIGHLVPVMRGIFGDKVKFSLIAPRRPLIRRLGLPGVGEALDAVEDRALWTRFGLPRAMIVRFALFVLVVVAVLSVIGKWQRLRGPRRPNAPAVESARKCADCGAYVLGSAPGPCDRPDCRFR